MNYLLDTDFLQQINEQQYKIFYAKIIALNINEDYVDEAQGKITGGSINIDGASAVRRTCSLTMVAADVNINDYYWSLKTKFKLEIGISNLLSNEYSPTFGKYPEIVWFPMGTYILTSFNTSWTATGLSISLSGKDKMCMLNGELGGQLFASIDFGTEETIGSLFREVTPTATSSDNLMNEIYYYEVDSENTEIENCIFNLDNVNGHWFLLNNSYIYDSLDQYVGNHYKKYKQVIHPDELFLPVSFGSGENTYEPSKYFYKETESSPYYLLNTTQSPKEENYQLRTLYKYEQTYSINKIPLEKIIRESVHTYALEPYHNIIIQDLENYGLEQISYKGDTPLVALRNVSTGHFSNIRFLDSFGVYDEEKIKIDLSQFEWDSLVEDAIRTSGSIIKVEDNRFILSSLEEYESSSTEDKKNFYKAAKIEYGQDIGYRITDLVYNGDLISGVGETLTSILDKIKNMLGDFEYFYDTDGRFIFRRKPIYVNTSWSHFVNNEDERYVTYSNDLDKYSFSFEGNILLTAIQNTPSLSNVKNDFIVWGKRQGVSGVDIPIHARYAIDKKPKYYKALNGDIYVTESDATTEKLHIVDWREIIYQMALDYFAGQGCSENYPLYILNEENELEPMTKPDDFLSEVAARNPFFYPTGYTGYEQYYTDMQYYWRQLYNPNFKEDKKYEAGKYTEVITKNSNGFYSKNKIWNDQVTIENENYYDEDTPDKKWWNKAVFEDPESLNFWIDFLDIQGELSQFSIPQIGDRQKVVNDDKVSAIIFKEIPDLILYDTKPSTEDPTQVPTKEMLDSQTGYTWIYIPNGFSQYLKTSYRYLSAKNKIDELIYQHAYCMESISLTSIPIYSLEPNTLIRVFDKNTNINGEYIINRIGFSLSYNGTMSISAIKAQNSNDYADNESAQDEKKWHDSSTTFSILSDNTPSTLTLHLTQTAPKTTKISWGDGTEDYIPEELMVEATHTYTTSSDSYVISIFSAQGYTWSPGININNEYRSFIEDDNITTISFGPGIKLIDASCFANHNQLSEVKFEKVDTSFNIPSKAFYNCDIRELEITSRVSNIDSYAFAQNYSLQNLICGATTIQDFAFYDCTHLENIWLTDTCLYFGNNIDRSPWINCGIEAEKIPIFFCYASGRPIGWGYEYNVYNFTENDGEMFSFRLRDRFITIWNQTVCPFELNNWTDTSTSTSISYIWDNTTLTLIVTDSPEETDAFSTTADIEWNDKLQILNIQPVDEEGG